MISRAIRSIRFLNPERKRLIDRVNKTVDTMRMLDRQVQALEKKIEATRSEELKKEYRRAQRQHRADLEKMATNGPSWQKGNAKEMLGKLDRGEKLASTYNCPVAVWQFGSDLTLVALSGEVVVDYVPLVEQAIGPLQLWITAYCNDVFGYFPSARVLREGGYECRGLYTTTGFFAPNAQDLLVAKVRDLAQRAGRTLPEPLNSPLKK